MLRDVLDYHVDTRNLDGMAKREHSAGGALPSGAADAYTLMEKILQDIETDVVMTFDGMRFWLPSDTEIRID